MLEHQLADLPIYFIRIAISNVHRLMFCWKNMVQLFKYFDFDLFLNRLQVVGCGFSSMSTTISNFFPLSIKNPCLVLGYICHLQIQEILFILWVLPFSPDSFTIINSFLWRSIKWNIECNFQTINENDT